jgi:hypothetical protein
MPLAVAMLFTSENLRARRTKAKARTKTRAEDAGLNAPETTTTTQRPCQHSPLRLQHHLLNKLGLPLKRAQPLPPNTTLPNPTDIAGSTDGFSPIPTMSANESSNRTTKHVSTLMVHPAPTPQAMRTLNPRTNHGGFEETRKTRHSVFHNRFRSNDPRCHNRGYYLHKSPPLLQSTLLTLPGSPGTTCNNHYFRCHNRG